MGKGGGGSDSGTQTVTNTSSPPPEVMAAYQQALSMANTASSAPLQQYQGQTVAGFTPDQNSAMSTVNNLQGISQPYIDQAQGLIQQGTQPLWNGVQQFSPEAISQYQSPYTQQVLNAQMGLEQNQDAQQQSALQGNAISQGAWGGDRAGVASAVLSGQQALANNSTNAGILNAGYTQGLNEFNTQQQAQLGANEANSYLDQQGAYGLGSLGQEALNTGLTGATAQLQSGQLQQTQNQANLNVPYEQFLQQQAYPFQTAQYYANIAEGIGGNSGGTSSTTSPTASTTAQNVGLGLGGLGVLGSLFGSKRGGAIPGGYRKGGGVQGIGFVPHRGQYAEGGDIPDLSVSYVPAPTSMSGGNGHNGIPSAPQAFKEPDQSKQSASNMSALAKLAPQLKGLFGGLGGGAGGGLGDFGGSNPLDAGSSNAMDMGGESNPLDWSSFGDFGGDAGGDAAGDAAADEGGDALADEGADSFFDFLSRGGTPHHPAHYDDGGKVKHDNSWLSTIGDWAGTIVGSIYGGPAGGFVGGKAGADAGGTLGDLFGGNWDGVGSDLEATGSMAESPNMGNLGGNFSNTSKFSFKRGGFAEPRHYDDGGDVDPTSPEAIELQNEAANDTPGDGGSGIGDPSVAASPQSGGGQKQRKPDLWQALATAGFGMAASQNPHWQGAAGEGGLLGIKNLNEQQKEADTANYQSGEIGVRKEEAEARAKEMSAQADRWNQMMKDSQKKTERERYAVTPTGMIWDKDTNTYSIPQLGKTGQSNLGGADSGQSGTDTAAAAANTPIVSGFPPSAIMMNPTKLKAATQADEQDIKSSNQNEQIGNNILQTLDHMDKINSTDPTLWGSGGDARTMLHKFDAFTGIGGQSEATKADLMNGLDKNSNDLATDWQKFEYVPGGRGSVLALKTILASKPGVGQTANVNSDIINELKGKVWDMKLGNQVANTYRQAANSPGVSDGNVNQLEDTLRTLYPTTTMDPQTGRTIFNAQNVQSYREAIPDAIQNPQKYFALAKQMGAQSAQQQGTPTAQGSAATPGAGGAGPSQSDISYLTANPGMAARFDAKFGPGAAEKYLGGQ